MEFKASRFDFSFFLPHRKSVPSLEQGAIEYGGATKVKDEVYSNYGMGITDTIEVNEVSNQLSIFIPSTFDIDKQMDNSQYVQKYLNIMSKRFDNIEVISDCKGSWYSDVKKKVVYDDIVVIKAYVQKVNANDIMFMQEIAKLVKTDMTQEGVTITINNSLAIV